MVCSQSIRAGQRNEEKSIGTDRRFASTLAFAGSVALDCDHCEGLGRECDQDSSSVKSHIGYEKDI